MPYKIEVYPEARAQMRALPREGAIALAEAIAMLELVPWNGEPQHRANPDGAVRRIVFGSMGLVIYLILEDQQKVDVLRVMWVG